MDAERLELKHYFDIRIAVKPPLDLGQTAVGHRRVVDVIGGEFDGPYMRGTVISGSDWQIVRPDHVTDVDVRCVLRTHDDVLIGVHSVGSRHAPPEIAARIVAGQPVADGSYYFRTTPRFEGRSDRYPDLWRMVFIGVGLRRPDHFVLRCLAVS